MISRLRPGRHDVTAAAAAALAGCPASGQVPCPPRAPRHRSSPANGACSGTSQPARIPVTDNTGIKKARQKSRHGHIERMREQAGETSAAASPSVLAGQVAKGYEPIEVTEFEEGSSRAARSG
jgi:hypothetical protein